VERTRCRQNRATETEPQPQGRGQAVCSQLTHLIVRTTPNYITALSQKSDAKFPDFLKFKMLRFLEVLKIAFYDFLLYKKLELFGKAQSRCSAFLFGGKQSDQ
jgi:hypothetical protein